MQALFVIPDSDKDKVRFKFLALKTNFAFPLNPDFCLNFSTIEDTKSSGVH